MASHNGHTDVVEALIKAKADVNLPSECEHTPLLLTNKCIYHSDWLLGTPE